MKLVVIIVIVTVFLIGLGVLSLFLRTTKQAYGTVIILNGPSGSGKSSIQKAFQQLMMPKLWCKIGIDMLFDMSMPNITPENMSFWQSPNPIRWVEKSADDQGNTLIVLHLGPEGKNVVHALHDSIADYARNGCNVIVDYIAYEPWWMEDLQKKLAGIKTYYVAVDISLETLENREAARGTSPKGHARSHYATVYGNRAYDVRVSSERNTPEEIAQQLKQRFLCE